MVLGSTLGAVTRATPWVIEITSTGGVLITGFSLILLKPKRVGVGILLPAIFSAPIIVLILATLNIKFQRNVWHKQASRSHLRRLASRNSFPRCL